MQAPGLAAGAAWLQVQASLFPSFSFRSASAGTL